MINDTLIEQYHRDGYVIVPGLFSQDEVERFKHHYMELNAQGQSTGEDMDISADDPLARYPRIMNLHRQDQLSREWLLDKRLDVCLTALLGASPYAVQLMFYFKPAGARGQALHQDQYYTRVQPGTCIAAWMAVDRCDEENGCLQVVPFTQNIPVLCSVPADITTSISPITVDLPSNMQPVSAIMEPGDVLFFNGQVVHGSHPNTSKDRFRRSMIGHYIVAEAEKVSSWFNPALRMDGTPIELEVSLKGGRCGVWVDEDDIPVVKLEGFEAIEGTRSTDDVLV